MRKLSFVFASLFIASVGSFGCGKKGGGGDVKSYCADVFDHAEKDNGKWIAGKGDRAKFMEFCLKQKAEVVRCSSTSIEFGDKVCEKSTGVMGPDHTGFDTKTKLWQMRDGQAPATP